MNPALSSELNKPRARNTSTTECRVFAEELFSVPKTETRAGKYVVPGHKDQLWARGLIQPPAPGAPSHSACLGSGARHPQPFHNSSIFLECREVPDMDLHTCKVKHRCPAPSAINSCFCLPPLSDHQPASPGVCFPSSLCYLQYKMVRPQRCLGPTHLEAQPHVYRTSPRAVCALSPLGDCHYLQ